MKNFRKMFSLLMCLMLLVSCIPSVFAADVADATIDMDAMCSLTLWKYDWTNAHKDGVWNEDSFISTGWRESYVEGVLGDAVREGDANGDKSSPLGNGDHSNGYAIKGVEFTYLKVAEIATFTESANDGHADYNMTQVLYGFDKIKAADLLTAIGLAGGAEHYANADATDKLDHEHKWYYTSDTLNTYLASALTNNSTTVKDALETYMKGQADATAMPLTDENGKTIVQNLPVGLYLLVETKVPEMVTSTTNPFFVSLPMTTISGDANSASPEGGHQWNYDVVLYPKNETGLITLEKTVREAKADTGTHGGSTTDIHDGYAHNATASAGDVIDYQIITSLPTITSQATALSTLNFYDSIDTGLAYNKTLKDVKIEIFTDAECTPAKKVASWDQDSGKFTVTYSSDDRHMTVDVTASGLAEINGQTTNVNGKLYVGYSNYTMRVTYTCTVVSNKDTVFGQNGNKNEVVLTWKRTSTDYYDTLVDDAHVYSFGIDLTKLFSDKDSKSAAEAGMFDHVKFKLYNKTDGYWVVASRDETENYYYVTDHKTAEADATVFYPVTIDGDKYGHIMIKGLEDDEYVLTEIETANGYTLLKDSVTVIITSADDATRPCDVYSHDTIGLLQNDPHYTFNNGDEDLSLAIIPQKHLAHNYLTASATVDGNGVTMLEDRSSANAEAPLTIKNTQGFNPPPTGDNSAMMMAVVGTLGMTAMLVFFVLVVAKKKKEQEAR